MRQKIYVAILLAAIVCGFQLVAVSCQQKPQETPAAAVNAAGHTFSVKGSVREMNIVPEVVNFPEGAGKNEFMSYCAMCHSLRYISMQPDFPAKIWDDEVHKMVDKYKAPIDSVTSKKIVAYLVMVKGAK